MLGKTRTCTSEGEGRITTRHADRRGVKGFVSTRKKFADVSNGEKPLYRLLYSSGSRDVGGTSRCHMMSK